MERFRRASANGPTHHLSDSPDLSNFIMTKKEIDDGSDNDVNANLKIFNVRHKNVFLFVPNIIGYGRLLLVFISWLCHAISRPNLTLTFYIFAAILDFFDGFAARRLRQTSVFGAWFDVCIDVIARTTLWNMIFSVSLTSPSSPSNSWLTILSASFPWGQLIAVLEWLAFVCNHAVHGSHWKTRMLSTEPSSDQLSDIDNQNFAPKKLKSQTCASEPSVQDVGIPPPPAWVSRCFANGFKSQLGVFAIAGVHGLPPWMYGCFVDMADRNRLWPCFRALLEWNSLVVPVLVGGRIYAACVECWIIWDHVKFLALRKDD